MFGLANEVVAYGIMGAAAFAGAVAAAVGARRRRREKLRRRGIKRYGH